MQAFTTQHALIHTLTHISISSLSLSSLSGVARLVNSGVCQHVSDCTNSIYIGQKEEHFVQNEQNEINKILPKRVFILP